MAASCLCLSLKKEKENHQPCAGAVKRINDDGISGIKVLRLLTVRRTLFPVSQDLRYDALHYGHTLENAALMPDF